MNMKTVLMAMVTLVMNVLAAQAHAGVVDRRGISKLNLTCDNDSHPSISYRVDILSGFFEVDGQKKWTTGANVYAVIHFTNKEELLRSAPVIAENRFTHIEGEGFSLIQSGPGNFNMRSFPALMRLIEASGDKIEAQLQCEFH